MSLICLIIALIFFGLAALKVSEPAIPSWVGAGLFFFTLSFLIHPFKELLS